MCGRQKDARLSLLDGILSLYEYTMQPMMVSIYAHLSLTAFFVVLLPFLLSSSTFFLFHLHFFILSLSLVPVLISCFFLFTCVILSQVKQLSKDLESERSLRMKKEELIKEKEAEVGKTWVHTHTP